MPQDVHPCWYVLNVANGKEMTVKRLLETKVETVGLQSEVHEFVVPTEVNSIFFFFSIYIFIFFRKLSFHLTSPSILTLLVVELSDLNKKNVFHKKHHL